MNYQGRNVTMDTAAGIDEVMQVVLNWPSDKRLSLVQEVLRTLQSDIKHPGRRRHPLNEALGLAATEGPPPSDEDVRRILETSRMERYG